MKRLISAAILVYAECSNHGSCDRVYGKCACERGFKGEACNDMRDAEDIVKHTHDGPFFTGSLLRLDMERDPSEVFSIFSARLNAQNVTTITGDRRLVHEGDVVVHGAIAVGSTGATQQSNVSDYTIYVFVGLIVVCLDLQCLSHLC